jgi:hypothetical protein
MDLKLHSFEQPRQSFHWNDFVSCFKPAAVSPHPHLGAGHWRLEHPTHPIHFFAQVPHIKRLDEIADVYFEFEDLAQLGEDGACAGHPLWAGLFKAMISWPAIVCVNPPSLGPAILVARPELLLRLPSWVHDPPSGQEHTHFVVPERANFDRLIAEAFALNRTILGAGQPRVGWADEIEQDEEARNAFADYVAGKRQKVATYTWGDRQVKPVSGWRGSFLDQYGIWVDWRALDDSIVEDVDKRLKDRRLGVKMLGEDLLISFGSSQRIITCEEIGTERYQTIRAINELMAPDFQMRLVQKTVNTDTHCFLLAPAWLWKHLEELDRAKLERRIKVIDDRDGFG